MKSWMYLALDLGSVLLPALFSFHPKIQFHKEFKGVFWGIATAAVLYISWDIYFTLQGVWGFNPEYLTGIQILSLPLEEWLFFICIPYACLFTMHVLSRTYLSRYSFSWTKNVFLLVAFFLVAIGGRDATQWYTITTFTTFTSICLVLQLIKVITF